jgi:hypothetical protein
MSNAAMNLKLAIARMHFAVVARDYDAAATAWLEAKHLADSLIQIGACE